MTRHEIALACAAGLGIGLACVAIDPDADLCALGGDGCACTQGGGCDPGLACVGGMCVDPDGGTSVAETAPSDTTSATTSATSTGDSSDDESDGTGASTDPNVVFVTSTMHDAASIGGLAGADVVCQARADAAGHEGTYRAWLSIPGSDARDRLDGARGWVRPDGLPFVRDVDELIEGRILYPLVLDENGTAVPLMSPVWTGTFEDGTAFDPAGRGMCGGWTIAEAEPDAAIGTVGAGQFWWTAYSGQSCSQPAHLYCFGVDADADVDVLPTDGRLAFGSAGGFAANGGRPAADALCQAEAAAAGHPGTFLALMAMPGEAAADRFDTGGLPWVRADGVHLFHPGDPMGDFLAAPVALDAEGNVEPFAMAWSGADSPTMPGTMESTCAGWTSTMGLSPLATVFHARWHLWSLDGGATQECSVLFTVLCFEQ